MSRNKIILVAIIILAGLLRLYRLGQIPISLNWDEAAAGYDAFSILLTGKDQYGHLFPLTFRALNDFRPPFMFYITIPSVFIFGLTELAVRFPSAIFGTLTILLIYLVPFEIFKKHSFSQKIGLFSALALAVSPWHIQFSRISSEHNIAVFFILGGILFFLKSRLKIINMYLAIIFFGLSLLTYHSARVVTPLIIISLIILYRKEIKFNLKQFFIILFLCILFIFPLVVISRSEKSGMRFSTMNILNIEKNTEISGKKILADIENGHMISGKIFHNRRLSIVNFENIVNFWNNYRAHFYLDFWLMGDNSKIYHAPGFGLMYFFEPILFLIGIIFYFAKKIKKNNAILLLILLFSPIGSAMAWGGPNSNRILFMIIPLTFFIAIGSYFIAFFLTSRFHFFKKIYLIILIPIYFFVLGSYLHQYFVHTNYDYSQAWLYEKKLGAFFSQRKYDKYDQIIVSNGKTDWPYIFWLFYTKYDPNKYLAKGGTISGDFRANENFENYYFKKITKTDFNKKNRRLIIGWPEDFALFQTKIRIIETMYYQDGKIALQAAEVL